MEERVKEKEGKNKWKKEERLREKDWRKRKQNKRERMGERKNE